MTPSKQFVYTNNDNLQHHEKLFQQIPCSIELTARLWGWKVLGFLAQTEVKANMAQLARRQSLLPDFGLLLGTSFRQHDTFYWHSSMLELSKGLNNVNLEDCRMNVFSQLTVNCCGNWGNHSRLFG